MVMMKAIKVRCTRNEICYICLWHHGKITVCAAARLVVGFPFNETLKPHTVDLNQAKSSNLYWIEAKSGYYGARMC